MITIGTTSSGNALVELTASELQVIAEFNAFLERLGPVATKLLPGQTFHMGLQTATDMQPGSESKPTGSTIPAPHDRQQERTMRASTAMPRHEKKKPAGGSVMRASCRTTLEPRQVACDVCGKLFTALTSAKSCSDECRAVKHRRYANAWYARKKAAKGAATDSSAKPVAPQPSPTSKIDRHGCDRSRRQGPLPASGLRAVISRDAAVAKARRAAAAASERTGGRISSGEFGLPKENGRTIPLLGD